MIRLKNPDICPQSQLSNLTGKPGNYCVYLCFRLKSKDWSESVSTWLPVRFWTDHAEKIPEIFNFAGDPGVNFSLHRKGTGQPRIPYNDAVEEALCFGWIHSLNRTIDDERFA